MLLDQPDVVCNGIRLLRVKPSNQLVNPREKKHGVLADVGKIEHDCLSSAAALSAA
jgi:hypothetical protein